MDVVGITELVALIGATTAGIAARQRKVEVERLNEQLRKINLSLRQQARAGTVYAPGVCVRGQGVQLQGQQLSSNQQPVAAAAAQAACKQRA